MYAEDPQIFASTIIITLEIPHNLSFLKSKRRNFPNHRNSNLKHTNISNIFIYKAVDNYIYFRVLHLFPLYNNPPYSESPQCVASSLRKSLRISKSIEGISAFPFFIIIKSSFLC